MSSWQKQDLFLAVRIVNWEVMYIVHSIDPELCAQDYQSVHSVPSGVELLWSAVGGGGNTADVRNRYR